MASFEQHCRDCEAVLGQRHEGVNRWLDELFRKYGPNHREHRHHWRGVQEAKDLWGEDGARAAVIHIVRDCGSVPTARSYEKTNLGIVIAPAFLLAERNGKQDDPVAQEDFLKAVEAAFKQGKRKGYFQKAGSSTVEPTDDNRVVVGSTPTPPTSLKENVMFEVDDVQQVYVNGQMHDVCTGCGSVVGHGCPDSEPCTCGEQIVIGAPVNFYDVNFGGMNGRCVR